MSPVRSDLEDFAPIVDATRRGAHRSRPSLTSELLPIASVVVVIAIVTAVVLTVLGGGGKDSGGDDDTAAGPAASSSVTTSPSTSPSATPEASSSPEASQTPEESPTQAGGDGLDKAVKYTVLNDTMTSGLAKKAATTLAGAGWTATATTGNTSPKGRYAKSVVYYKSDADEANAKQIAADLGIEEVTKSSTKSKTTPVTVVLGKDFTG